ncbi:STAS/SEC14 domain-containing protein [Myxococcus sp. AM011]|uniref:STAS/SEC14 domain-containing protein n=1 Tax=Myxococcus sp. AM011 TaxID=2745200 RepID=UPI0015956DFE|nr:STAS/SEC14 domain-containing protein [Myxococcus sp. AM011]NVJ26466.1 STAS/SEC14 domain-containing protein [Myxococcus sp. AM011]
MVRMWTFGDSKMWFESPDFVRLVQVGVFDLKLIQALCGVGRELMVAQPRLYLLCDARRGSSISLEARKALSETPEVMPYAGIVIFGASFALRTMASMMGTPSGLLGRTQGASFGMVDTEEEARSWVAARRSVPGAVQAS